MATNVQIPEEIRRNQFIYDEYFEPEFSKELVGSVLSQLDKYYFRSRLVGFENFPERNNPDHPLIFISNHSGMAFPWDAIIFSAHIFRENGYRFHNMFRSIASPMLSQTILMNPFLIENFWRRAGGIDATSLNFETMMFYEDSHVLIYPEGVPGIGKGFNRKYQLQRFASSFVRMSLKYRTDVIPVLTVNGEYVNPYSYSFPWVNRLSQKIGIPFLPIGIMTLLIPLQPWMFYFGFPAKLTYVMGERIRPYEMTDKPFESLTLTEFRQIADEVKGLVQKQLDEAVREYGRKPYAAGELVRNNLKNLRKFPFFLPTFWPSIFLEFERQYNKRRRSRIKVNFWIGLRSFLRNPIALAFFLPVIGWIPIILRGYRRKRGGRRHGA